MTYAVRGEAMDGGVLTLRLFSSREAAESHPVVLSHWRRVWVEKVAPPPPSDKRSASLRRPWRIEQPNNVTFTYLLDADGARIATFYGRAEQHERMTEILRQAGLVE